ncbi:ribonuclease E [Ralstonia soli]|uniref:Ribonuclease E n=1 Tax=Ralstonia soli TaxID=2953896 RepID=A0ABT1ASY8_9RALS|nr:ribonuclease E [Ralstonia soli]MCO5401336.1 ribonuclease E [Ralstonia soli]
MDSLNFIIDGHLGLPGFVRVPPPFGTPRDAVRAIKGALASTSEGPQPQMQSDAGRHVRWRRRLTVLAIGAACTVVAALTGWHTGQHRQPVSHFDQATLAAISQPPAPIAAPERLPTTAVQSADPVDEGGPAVATAAHVVAQAAVKTVKPRTSARAIGRAAAPKPPARPAAPVRAKPTAIETYRAMADTAPITSGYVAPGTSVRIELQRHTRLTD